MRGLDTLRISLELLRPCMGPLTGPAGAFHMHSLAPSKTSVTPSAAIPLKPYMATFVATYFWNGSSRPSEFGAFRVFFVVGVANWTSPKKWSESKKVLEVFTFSAGLLWAPRKAINYNRRKILPVLLETVHHELKMCPGAENVLSRCYKGRAISLLVLDPPVPQGKMSDIYNTLVTCTLR